MRIRSEQTTIEYAGRILVQPGGHFDGDALSSSLDTTTEGIALVDSPFVKIQNFKNAQATRNFSFAYDFDSVEDAYLFKLEAEEHAVNNPCGHLSVSVKNTIKTYKAGLTQISTDIYIVPDKIRVILKYEFITGGFVQ